MKYLSTIIIIALLPVLTRAQVRITAAAGLSTTEKGPRINGLLNAGYEYQQLSVMADIRSTLFKNAAYLGIHAGYNVLIEEDVYFKPYIGAWYRKTGKTAAQDRYIKDGVTTVLSTTAPGDRNGFNAGFGAQLVYHYFFIDLSSVDQWQFSIGCSYKF